VISPTVAYVLIAASANVIGAAAVTSRSQWSISALGKLVALSAGFMISVALLDLIPESIGQRGAGAGLIILGGYVLVHLTQHTLTPHFHFGEEVHQVTQSVSVSALVGLLLHTFVDGVAIASGFVPVSLGPPSGCARRGGEVVVSAATSPPSASRRTQ